jgi:hypothetical protein
VQKREARELRRIDTAMAAQPFGGAMKEHLGVQKQRLEVRRSTSR